MIVNSLTPLISIIFDLLITFGTIQLGRILSLKSIFKDELIFNLIFGFLFITQFIFIYFIILKSNGIFSFVAYSLLILGLYYLLLVYFDRSI